MISISSDENDRHCDSHHHDVKYSKDRKSRRNGCLHVSGILVGSICSNINPIVMAEVIKMPSSLSLLSSLLVAVM